MSTSQKPDKEIRLLAAMAYGEASMKDDANEMSALASVLVRQRDARGHANMLTFTSKERTFSFVVADGNMRYKKLMNASDSAIQKDPGMSAAWAAAENALSRGADLSNGAYFWDGADIKTNYKNHFKVRQGIRFSDPAHNIYGIDESSSVVILTNTRVERLRGKVVNKIVIEVGRYDHVYVSTAAHGGTIFWKFNPEYVRFNRAKEYK